MALVAPLLTSAMPITRVNRSAVNGVVNAVTGRNKDNNAPVPVEETQETQEAAQRMENEARACFSAWTSTTACRW